MRPFSTLEIVEEASPVRRLTSAMRQLFRLRNSRRRRPRLGREAVFIIVTRFSWPRERPSALHVSTRASRYRRTIAYGKVAGSARISGICRDPAAGRAATVSDEHAAGSPGIDI